jgi:isopenicillin N synthase-like dioxygenase
MIQQLDFSIILCKECSKETCGNGFVCRCWLQKSGAEAFMKSVLGSLAGMGFLQIVGHGVDEEMISRSIEKTKEFFLADLGNKETVVSKDKARRGYSSVCSENFATLIGNFNEPNDIVEKFRIGPITDFTNEDASYFSRKDVRTHFLPNCWPSFPCDFEKVISLYYEAMSLLAFRILDVIACSFGLPSEYFREKFNKHTSILSLNCFPDGITPLRPTRGDGVQIAAHTDVSVLTLVTQSELTPGFEGGLEVFDSLSKEWKLVPYLQNSIVVNVGDCLQDWSRQLLMSALHRVRVNPAISLPAAIIDVSGKCDDRIILPEKCTSAHSTDFCRLGHRGCESLCSKGASTVRFEKSAKRYSMAFFFTPNVDALLEPLPFDRSGVVCQEFSKNSNHIEETVLTYDAWRKHHIKKAMKRI